MSLHSSGANIAGRTEWRDCDGFLPDHVTECPGPDEPVEFVVDFETRVESWTCPVCGTDHTTNF